MKKISGYIWPTGIIVGLSIILTVDAGNGMSSPFYWLIPVGIIGSILHAVYIKELRQATYLSVVWALAYLSIYNARFGWWGCEGLGCLGWIAPAIGLVIIGTIMKFWYLGRKQ